MRLTKKQKVAFDYFGLSWAKSDDPYGIQAKTGYPGSSCECIESVVGWYDEKMKNKGKE